MGKSESNYENKVQELLGEVIEEIGEDTVSNAVDAASNELRDVIIRSHEVAEELKDVIDQDKVIENETKKMSLLADINRRAMVLAFSHPELISSMSTLSLHAVNIGAQLTRLYPKEVMEINNLEAQGKWQEAKLARQTILEKSGLREECDHLETKMIDLFAKYDPELAQEIRDIGL